MHNHVRCSHCNLTNFADAEQCKRCKNPLQNTNYSSQGNTLNININLPPGIFQQPTIRQLPQPPHQADEQYVEDQPRQSVSFQAHNYQHYQAQQPISFQEPDYGTQQTPPPGYNQWSPMTSPVYSHPYPQMMPGQGVWRRGDEMVVHRNAQLPATCVKCGHLYSSASDISYVKQKYRWHNPFIYIALISPLIYCILSLALSQTVRLEIPLCQKHVDDRSSTLKFMTGGGVLAAIIVVFSFSAGNVGFGILLFLAALIGLALTHEYLYKPLRISKIENDYVHLKGVNDGYLNQFPYC